MTLRPANSSHLLTSFGFTQPDPLADPYTWLSPYAYCGADPINFIDPTGLFDSKKEAEEWAKKNGIKTGFLRDHKIQQQEDGTWAVVNNKKNLMYSRDHSLDDIEYVSGRGTDGVTESVIVYPTSSEDNIISDIWNCGFVRNMIPDVITVGVGFSGILGLGAGSSCEFNWIIRGPEASIKPILSITQNVGAGFSVDAIINVGGTNYIGPVSNIKRDMVATSIANRNIGGFGSLSLTEVGNPGVTVTVTSYNQKLLIGRQIDVGLGLPAGPVPINGALGTYNTYILKDFSK